MIVRKIFGVLLAVLLVFTAPAVLAADTPENLLTGNADFEKGLGSDFEGWNVTKLGGWEPTISKEHARSGKGSLVMSVSKEKAEATDITMAYSDGTAKFEAGTEYIMSAWVRTVEPMKHVDNSTRFGVQVYARVNGESGAKYNISEPVHKTDGKWQKIEKTFTLASAEDTLQFYLRFTAGTYGSIFIDDVQVNRVSEVDMRASRTEPDKGKLKADAEPPVPDTSLAEIPEGSMNLFANGSFEAVGADGAPENSWMAYGGVWNDMVQVVDGGYDGNKCVRIKTDNTEANPWIYKDDFAVVAGMEYQISVWLKTITVKGSGPRFKIEFYNEEGANFISSQSEMFGKTYGVWHQKSCTFTAPMGAVRCKVYMRLYNAGEIYWDAVECYAIGSASRVKFEGDTFFYTEWEKGTVGVSLNTGAYVPTGEEVFDIALKDGETVLDSRMGAKASPEAMFEFEISALAEIGKEYTVEATLYEKAGGAVMETAEWPVYRYNRPTAINANGEYVHNGEVITPVWGYHVFSQDENLKLAKAAGVNVIQGGGASLETGKAYLDLAEANGMLATLILYSGMKSAGSEGQIENTIKMVEGLKDHPALFGYLVMDEPYLHMSDPYPDLVKAYKTIRDIDPVHPVIIQDVEATGSTKYTAATSDILVIHNYACNIRMMPDERYGMQGTANVIQNMMDDLENTHVTRKVVHYLGQSFGADTKEEATGYYLPTIDEAKSMQYQALLEGMEGIGYYSFQETGWHIKDTPLYAPLCEFAEEELFLLTDAFMFDRGIFFNEDRTGDVWWHTFAMDGSLYAMALNMKEEAKSVEIPLVSANGAITIGSYTGTLVGGTNLAASVSGGGSLKLDLVPHGTALYKLTPAEAADFSSLEKNFDDMENHAWAQEAVDFLYEEGVVNTTGIRTYSPGTNITRADFAMFLIRALNITGEATEVFGDVDADAYYAKEIAIGKAAGILKGVGDDAYNPDAEITRQDMMVIVQRGLAYADSAYEKGESTDLDGFSDKELIADYAVEALSSMVKSGIILGNADGTVNPLGNATRAEAVMVMQRIMQ